MNHPIVVHELYFVVAVEKLEMLTELPRLAYVSLLEAVRAQNGRSDF